MVTDTTQADYRVDLDIYNGPLDLLLHLIKKDELNVYDIPISRILDQFLEHLRSMKDLDVDGVGDFLVMASTLMVIKSRMLLPELSADEDEEPPDPRTDLVRQLLEYRRFKELGALLRERMEAVERMFPRGFDEVFERQKAGEETVDLGQALGEIELYDLFQAFSKVLSEIRVSSEREIVYDDTPIEAHVERLDALLRQSETISFSRLFQNRRDRGYVIGVFLGVLEMIRLGKAIVTQEEPFGEIVLRRRPFPKPLPPDPFIESQPPPA
ncbi:MAG: segregation/condensation protein A [Planctomycetes bacterium]|nr:segregation/condensation protein A [Planctomycetota bacterium]MBI3848250.1 segregation/condensation protein A [Planctomycetota bacterium]